MTWQNNQAWGQQTAYPQGFSNPMAPQQSPYMQRPQVTNMDWIRVPNVADMDQVTVQPGQTAWVMAQNTNVFAVRSADQMGITSTRYFQFSEFDPRQTDQQRQDNFEQRLRRLEAIFDATEPTS